MSEINLWLIRHGESTSNINIWSADPANVALTQKGEKQAQEISQAITEPPDLLILSPAKRAQDTARPMIERWPNLSKETWPIQEFIYLSPSLYQNKSAEERRLAKENYWQKADPHFCDGKEAESFADFISRLKNFHERILTQQGFITAFGHGQFFKAYQLGLEKGFASTSEWMKNFRQFETAHPILNGEIIKLRIKEEN